jgi:glycosyltransferase involved in cell wall biosynthesis
MSQLPIISVVIPCYQQAQFLAEAVQCALDPNYPTKEVVVVNDGSPDDTREVAARFGERIVYVEQANKGLSGARNAGIRAAHGEYVALLDSDDICLPGRLATQAAILQERPDVGMVAIDALLYDGQQVIGPKSAVSGQPKHPTDFRWETVEYCATPSTALIRRECFAAIGYFNERVRGRVGSGGEDWLLFVQLSLRYALVYQTFPTILYRLHPHSGTRNLEGSTLGIARRASSPSTGLISRIIPPPSALNCFSTVLRRPGASSRGRQPYVTCSAPSRPTRLNCRMAHVSSVGGSPMPCVGN